MGFAAVFISPAAASRCWMQTLNRVVHFLNVASDIQLPNLYARCDITERLIQSGKDMEGDEN